MKILTKKEIDNCFTNYKFKCMKKTDINGICFFSKIYEFVIPEEIYNIFINENRNLRDFSDEKIENIKISVRRNPKTGEVIPVLRIQIIEKAIISSSIKKDDKEAKENFLKILAILEEYYEFAQKKKNEQDELIITRIINHRALKSTKNSPIIIKLNKEIQEKELELKNLKNKRLDEESFLEENIRLDIYKDIKNKNYKIEPEIGLDEVEKAYCKLGKINPEKEVIKKCVDYYIEKNNKYIK